MAIGVEGQFHLSFTIGTERDFMALEDLHEFSETSEAGNVIPTFSLTFSTSNERIFGLLNEGNDIRVSFGQSYDSALDYVFCASKVSSSINEGKATFSCIGLLSRLPYLSNPKRRIIGPLSGVEVAEQVCEENQLIFDSNIAKSSDSQRWIQANVSDRKFVSDCLLHSFVAGSFLASALSSDGQFRVRDIRKLAKETEPVWIFNQTASRTSAPNEILYSFSPEYEVNTGFINYWIGYGQEKGIFSLEDSDLRTISEDVRPVIALTDQLARRAGMEKKYQSTAIQNENVHPNYWKAALQNVTNAAVFGTIKITLTFEREFKDVRVLDLVSFFDSAIDDPNAGSSRAQSGLYLVSRVTRAVKNKQLSTTVVLCREATNEVSGEIREAQPEPTFNTQFGVAGTPSKPVE